MALFNFFKTLFERKAKRKRKSPKKAGKKKSVKRVKKTRRKIKRKPAKRIIRKKTKKKISKKSRKKSKRVAKRISKRKTRKKIKPSLKAPKEKEIGVITHYFDKISVGIIKLKSPLAVSEHIRIKGKACEFTQVISSMQYNHKDIVLAEKGLEIGIKTNQPVRENDLVYKVI